MRLLFIYLFTILFIDRLCLSAGASHRFDSFLVKTIDAKNVSAQTCTFINIVTTMNHCSRITCRPIQALLLLVGALLSTALQIVHHWVLKNVGFQHRTRQTNYVRVLATPMWEFTILGIVGTRRPMWEVTILGIVGTGRNSAAAIFIANHGPLYGGNLI